MHRKRLSLITAILLLALLVGGLGWLIYAPIRQERLNHALIVVIKKNDTKKALALLAEGADPNSKDEPPKHQSLWRLLLDRLRGKPPAPSKAPTALLVALIVIDEQYPQKPQNNVDIIRALLDKGADPNVIDEEGDFPLLLAAQAGMSDEIILLLLEHGANVNLSNSPLFWAIANENTSDKVIIAMLDRGANVNVHWYDGITPLTLAIMQKRVEVVKRILAHHPDLKGIALSVAKDYASTPKRRQIIQMLKQAGAKE